MKKKGLNIAILVLGISWNVTAQEGVAVKYANTIQEKELSEHLHVLASDEYEGRETGRKGQKMAMDYLIKEFSSYGIEPSANQSYVQKFDLVEQKNSGIEINIKGKTFIVNKDFTIGGSILKNDEIKTEVVFVGYGIKEEGYDNYENLNVEGKFVFFLEGKPQKIKINEKWSNKSKVELAKSKGAIGVMFHEADLKSILNKYAHYFERPKMKLKEEIKEDIYKIQIGNDLAETLLSGGNYKLKKLLKKGYKKQIPYSEKATLLINKPTEDLVSENVLAFIPGTSHANELIVITAHYDHIGKKGEVVFNGADDDGSGTVALIEIAEAFAMASKEGNGPKRSILVMPVSGEEKGLLGSKYYTNHPVYPLENTVANLNIDMIGRYDEKHLEDSNYVYLIGSDRLSSELHQTSEEVNNKHFNINLDYTFNDENDPNRFYYRSDHYNFAKNNIPVIFYFNGTHADYHKETDTVEKIDFKKIEKITRLVFLTAWELANREERIVVDQNKK